VPRGGAAFRVAAGGVGKGRRSGMTNVTDILETFDLLGDWEQRYQYLVELGEGLPALPETQRTEDNRVKPCMSQVWVASAPDPVRPGHVTMHGDCDTAIIKGVVALLLSLCDGKTPREILQLDFDRLFEGLKLAEHLSPSRHVGIYAIVEKIREQAQQLAAAA